MDLIIFKIFNKNSKLFKNDYLLKKEALIINVSIFSLNAFLLICCINILKKDNINIFKYSDYFKLYFLKNSYKDISSYLSNKYNINNSIISNLYISKKILKIKCTGLFDRTYHLNWLRSKLDNEFILEFNESDPDYLIYNVFSDEDMESKYQHAIKIAIYTENVMPDINQADYAIGHYHINYLDRFFKYSIVFWQKINNIDIIRKEVLRRQKRIKFCGAVIKNCESNFRLNFIDKLNNYKIVEMGGDCGKNIQINVTDKIKFLSDYKFSIAMENSNGDGYISEKIIDSFLAGTIPIYYGDYMLDEYINPKTYILIKSDKDIDNKIKYIMKIDNDDDLYKDIMKEKPKKDKYFIDKKI